MEKRAPARFSFLHSGHIRMLLFKNLPQTASPLPAEADLIAARALFAPRRPLSAELDSGQPKSFFKTPFHAGASRKPQISATHILTKIFRLPANVFSTLRFCRKIKLKTSIYRADISHDIRFAINGLITIFFRRLTND